MDPIEYEQGTCGTCTHYTPYDAMGTSHLRYYGTCEFIEKTRDTAEGIIYSQSPVMIRWDMTCHHHPMHHK